MPGDYLIPVYEPNHTYDKIHYDVPTTNTLVNGKAEARSTERTVEYINTSTKSRSGTTTCSRRCRRGLFVAGLVSMVVCLILTLVNVMLMLSVKGHQGREHTHQAEVKGTHVSWEWGPWGPCDAICGYGMRSRERYCGNKPCDDGIKDKHICRRDDCVGRPVGFSAVLRQQQENVDRGSILVYKDVDYNHGNGYNNKNGIFTCPQSGVYLFLMFVQGLYNDADDAAHETSLVFKIDGVSVRSLVSEPFIQGQDETGGNAVLKSMTKGQKAWIETYYGDNQAIYSGRTTFSGVLLR